MGGGAFGLLRIPEWMLKFVYLTLLWIVFSLIGLILLGVFPATAALFAIQRQWVKKDADLPITKHFIHFYKKNFVNSNLLGYIWVITGFTLFIYFQLIQLLDGSLYTVIYYLFLVLTLFYVLTASYSFAVLVHFEMKWLSVIKNAFLIMIISPLNSLMIVSGFVILFFLFWHNPGLLFIFGPSVLTFLIMFSAYLAFNHLEKKQQQLAGD